MSQMRITVLKVLLAGVRIVGQIAASHAAKNDISNTINEAAAKIEQCEKCEYKNRAVK